MALAAMRFKDYIWPNNPRTYSIRYERRMAAHKVPFGPYELQDLGQTHRVMKGEGEFVGTGAYEEFKKLASVFYSAGAGTLVHPVWQAAEAYFVDLRLRQEPRGDYVSYAFTFWETGRGQAHTLSRVEEKPPEVAISQEDTGGQYHTVKKGENLWMIARVYEMELSELIRLNPQIKNPNLIMPGDEVRIR